MNSHSTSINDNDQLNGIEDNHSNSDLENSTIKWKKSIRIALKRSENGEMSLHELEDGVKKYVTEKYPNHSLTDDDFRNTFLQKVQEFDVVVRLNKKIKI